MTAKTANFFRSLPLWVKLLGGAALAALLVAFPIAYPKSYVMGVMAAMSEALRSSTAEPPFSSN